MAKVKTQGCELYILDSTDTGNEVRKIGALTDIGEISASASEIDVTDLDSVAREYFVGLVDNGSVTMGVDYDPQNAGQQNARGRLGGANVRWLLALSESATQPTYSAGYTLPTDRTTFDFTASVQAAPVGGGADDILRGSLTLRISGGVTETPAS